MDQVGDQDRPAEGDDGAFRGLFSAGNFIYYRAISLKSKGDMEAFNAHMI